MNNYMPWFWDSYKEYAEHINPIYRDELGVLRYQSLQSWAEHEVDRLLMLGEVKKRLDEVKRFLGNSKFPRNAEKAHDLLCPMVCAAENMLAYDRRLGQTREASDFAHAKDELLRNWDRFLRKPYQGQCISRLVMTTERMLEILWARTEEDRDFLVGNLSLPDSLMKDFRSARDLFSIGFEEQGAFVAGRGLEGILQETLRRKKITYKGKPAQDEKFSTMLEVLDRLRWKSGGGQVIAGSERTLLHLLREHRNIGGHPKGESKTPREVATLTVHVAQDLYDRLAQGKKQFATRTL